MSCFFVFCQGPVNIFCYCIFNGLILRTLHVTCSLSVQQNAQIVSNPFSTHAFRRRNFPFRKRSLPSKTVDAFPARFLPSL
jgi:hypothetical protein